MHAEEWIWREGKYLRRINADQLRKKLGREKGQCTWCGGKVVRPFRVYCSRQCKYECDIRLYLAPYEVKRRDKGVCAKCGLDTIALQRRVRNLCERAKDSKRCYSWQRIRRYAIRVLGSLTGNPFDIDHILPVVEGGGLCGIEGYRTLCKGCHKAETKALQQRLAAGRKRARSLPAKSK